MERGGRYLSRSLFPPAVFRLADVHILRATAVREVDAPDSGFELQVCGPKDQARIGRVDPARVEFPSRFRAGWQCLLGVLDGEPVSVSWHTTGPTHVSQAHAFTLELGQGSAWEHSVHVRPASRGKGLFDLHWSQAWRRLRDDGIRQVYAPIASHNHRSLRAHVRIGFEVIYDYHVLRVGGLVRHRAEPRPGTGLSASAGWGPWSGDAT